MKVRKYTYHAQMLAEMDRSARYKKVCDVFALTEDKLNRRPILEQMELEIGGILYITGFSGAGKSTLLRLIQSDFQAEVIEIPQAPDRVDVPIIDLLGEDLDEAIQLLGWVGLGESYLYLSPYRALSEGQKARFQLALSLGKKPKMLLIDEFLSNLDRITAKVVAYSFQKTCRKLGISAIVATAHDDLTEALAPDTLVTLDLNGANKIVKRPVDKPYLPGVHDLPVVKGTLDDYEQLKRFHYFGGAEFAEDDEYDVEIYATRYEEMCIGVCVLVAPYPRDWNEVHYFREVNERVKRISRLVVHPSFRGAGLATPLMRPAPSNVPFIETRSALGLYMPVYLAGEFRPVELASNRVSERRQMLWDRLQELGADPQSLPDAEVCAGFLAGLVSEERESLTELAREVLVELVVCDYLYFREIVELPDLTVEQHQEVWDLLLDAFDELPLDYLLHETAYFKMQGFAVKHQGV